MVDSFTGWPEAIRAQDRNAETVKLVLQTTFSRNGMPQVLVSDNAAKFSHSTFFKWLWEE